MDLFMFILVFVGLLFGSYGIFYYAVRAVFKVPVFSTGYDVLFFSLCLVVLCFSGFSWVLFSGVF